MSAKMAATAAVAGALALVLTGCVSTPDYKASITSLTQNDGQVSVAFRVANNGDGDGDPTCTFGIYDGAGTQIGDRTVNFKTIKAHSAKGGSVMVDVKGTADQATSVVACS